MQPIIQLCYYKDAKHQQTNISYSQLEQTNTRRSSTTTYPSSFHLGCQHDHHRGALLPRHLPEVGASVGQRALARYVAVYQTGSRDLHLCRGRETNRCRDVSSQPSVSVSPSLPAGRLALFVQGLCPCLCSYSEVDFNFTFELEKKGRKINQ